MAIDGVRGGSFEYCVPVLKSPWRQDLMNGRFKVRRRDFPDRRFRLRRGHRCLEEWMHLTLTYV
jgi:hypothetical protein